MFFRKGEKLLLVIFVLIMVCAMSGCGLIGKFYKDGEINIMNSVTESAETEAGETDDVINEADTLLSYEEISIDMSEFAYEKVPFNYVAVHPEIEIYEVPDNSPIVIETREEGEAVPIYFQTEVFGRLWGKTDEGWVDMNDVAYNFVYEDLFGAE